MVSGTWNYIRWVVIVTPDETGMNCYRDGSAVIEATRSYRGNCFS